MYSTKGKEKECRAVNKILSGRMTAKEKVIGRCSAIISIICMPIALPI